MTSPGEFAPALLVAPGRASLSPDTPANRPKCDNRWLGEALHNSPRSVTAPLRTVCGEPVIPTAAAPNRESRRAPCFKPRRLNLASDL
jgi:hypothetical protein